MISIHKHYIYRCTILAQGEIISNEKPVAMVSRSTSKTEQNYTQLDLEAMAVVYGLRCFHTYSIGKNWKNKTKTSGLSFLFIIWKGTKQPSKLFKLPCKSVEISKQIRERDQKILVNLYIPCP